MEPIKVEICHEIFIHSKFILRNDFELKIKIRDRMKKEILLSLNLSDSKLILLDYHSVLNLFNVLHLEIEKLIEKVNDPYLNKFKGLIVDVYESLIDPNIDSKLDVMEDGLNELIKVLKGLEKVSPEYQSNIGSVLNIIEIAFTRVDELKVDRFKWQEIPISDFEDKLFNFLYATEKVSRNRFHIKVPPELASEKDYLIDLVVNSDSDTLFAPPVIRDLVANSRKYSKSGSTIKIHLSSIENNGLQLIISDEGIGIPEDEIEQVVKFESRASNTKSIKTMGNGFGLTKAYHICKINKGRFFIESVLGKGTTIEMTLFPIKDIEMDRD